jgi:hypothetical protein
VYVPLAVVSCYCFDTFLSNFYFFVFLFCSFLPRLLLVNMDAKSLFVYGLLAASAVTVSADLRKASQPRAGYVVRQRNNVQFVTKTAVYIEPSAFNYTGLAKQREKAYDNFLRSNIDNEQGMRQQQTAADSSRHQATNTQATNKPSNTQRTARTQQSQHHHQHHHAVKYQAKHAHCS